MESPRRPDAAPPAEEDAQPTPAKADAGPSPVAPPGDGGEAAGDPKSVRAARLELIREQIASGAYDTPDRLDAALDGLLADLLD
ncbi:hypothetical protein [Alienimonas sp. DA493]|uniref:hypothetical protein n=1 Tax=Alienimonas sp. DA493 TaxID=3373605 RepID=UPI0037547CD6